ncbi:hypothetical protein [Sphingomonas carotinifaciens]|uniref:Uncharacterized protein n=2 Tax=Sphingomonas carotinifaciens TaxID=1166323 RepID=A0A1G7NHH5_9SPHN|nr:hypothetical protein [Sphingomonas carotinifaciens]MBB4087075.1 hypothetical protein [Sphingomonas carotinifaciens]SDF73545.1 hypothetical protein SAMN05216557_105170 [Sphingomonas carotinifaciens]
MRQVHSGDRQGVGTAAPVDPTPVPPAGSLASLDREMHRVVAHIGRRLLLANVATNTIFLVQEGARGDLRLPTRKVWIDLVEAGRAEVVRSDAPVEEPAESSAAKVSLQCDMLDAAGVPLGAKAMDIWLHRHWTSDLIARWGPHDSVHTPRFWRRERRREATR